MEFRQKVIRPQRHFYWLLEIMNWYPEIEIYDPKLSVEDWKKLLQDETIFSVTDLEKLWNAFNITSVAELTRNFFMFTAKIIFSTKTTLKNLVKELPIKQIVPFIKIIMKTFLFWNVKQVSEQKNTKMRTVKIRNFTNCMTNLLRHWQTMNKEIVT